MKPAAFEYHRPRTLDEAIALVDRHGGDAKPLAGGQSLIPAMNFRLATPSVVVDLNGVGELAFIRAADEGVAIGGMTRQRAVERSDLVGRSVPLLSEAMPYIAHPAIRNRGTIGGSLAHADPAAELPAVMLALGATFTASRAGGARSIAAADFFLGLFTTALEPGELLTEIHIPTAAERSGFAFMEVSRRHGDYALAGVAAAVRLDPGGRCAGARVALFSVGDRPVLAESASKRLVGAAPTPDAMRDAAREAAANDIDPPGDIHASAAYRRHLADVLMGRALERAFQRAGSSGGENRRISKKDSQS